MLCSTAVLLGANGDIFDEETGISFSASPNLGNCDTKLNFCENVKDYPENFITRHLGSSFDKYFKTRDYGTEIPFNPSIFGDEYRACEYKQQLAQPRAARNVAGAWRYIVNSERKNLKQYVEVETCRNEDEYCANVQKHLMPGYSTRCSQLFVKRSMVAIDETTFRPYADEFTFPSACVCYVKQDISYRG